ncbi:MAG: hypothetical protein DDT42_01614 [candidate division WS2 bacterium]|uniref:Terminase large subunit n=1 Tax=Psychracetigena formicireducens TaxID=2986056 RepID=A0A9E2F7M1_PSYF1|nr:hypothetical protein [Candidatus Psychracetigena formicireducens]
MQNASEEFIKCALNPFYAIEKYIQIPVKNSKGQIDYYSFKLMPHQIFILNNLINDEKNIISKYRQAGVTTLICAFLAYKLNFTPNFKVGVVANKLNTAKNEILKLVHNMYQQFPEEIRFKNAEPSKQDHRTYENGSEIRAFAASPDGMRGFSPSSLFIDEAAFCENGDDFYTSAMGTLAAGGSVILASTPNGLDELYYKTYEQALSGRNGFKLSEIHWYLDPRFNTDLVWKKEGAEDVVERTNHKNMKRLMRDGYKPTSSWYLEQCKKYNFNKKKIAQEVENSFSASAGTFISEEDIRRHESQYVAEPIRMDDNKYTWIWEEPQENVKYVMGIDPSLGRGEDFSVFNILKITDSGIEQVVEYHGDAAPDHLGVLAYKYADKYKPLIVTDFTGGYGFSTVEKLFEFGYPKNMVYHSGTRSKAFLERYSNGNSIIGDEIPGIIIGANRPLILSEFENLIRNDFFFISSARLISELKTFEAVGGTRTADHKRGYHDDLIFSVAIALYVIKTSPNKLKNNTESVKKNLDLWLATMDMVNGNNSSTGNTYLDNKWLFK